LGHAFATIREKVPAEMRHEFDQELEGMEHALEFDLKRDVLQNFGPNFTWGSKGDVYAAIKDGDPFEGTLAIQVHDAKATRALIDRLVQSGAVPLKPRSAGDVKFYSLCVPLPEAPPWLDVSFGIAGDALVVATSGDAFKKAAAAAAGSE